MHRLLSIMAYQPPLRREAYMPPCESLRRVAGYHDGQMTALDAEKFEEHLASCSICSNELAELREVSAAFADIAAQRISKAALSRIHDAIDEEEPGYSIFRIGGLLAGLAASVLVIGSAWLWENQDSQTPHSLVVIVPSPNSWEQMAMMDPRADALPGNLWNPPGQPMLADARLADWMVANLNGKFQP